MLSAFTNSLKIPELRSRIFYTLALLFVARVGAHIPLPGLDMTPLLQYMDQQGTSSGGVMGMINMFTGGALTKGAICAMGIMPYISSSIIFQLMTAVVPALSRLQQEGDVGRQKITQYQRYATVVICLIQGTLLALVLEDNAGSLVHGYDPARYGELVIENKAYFLVTSVIFMTAGTMLWMWLGEQITQRGIGNGVSLLITINILSQIPQAVGALDRMFFKPVGTGESATLPFAAIMIFFFFAVTMGIIAITQGQRKIPVQYAKRVIGNKVMGGQSSFLPLKVNYSGVMPVIFAQAILMFPAQIMSQLGTVAKLPFLSDFAAELQRGHWVYYTAYSLLILFFSYFWVSVMFKPIQIADDLKKYGGYVPGVRPGEPTAHFLDFVMTRLTLAGAIALTVIAVIPDLLFWQVHIEPSVAYYFGGTGMLIVVGVILDTMRQVETFLLQRHYDGFLRKGRIRARSAGQQGSIGDALPTEAVMTIVWPLLGLLLLGLGFWAVGLFHN